jgi:plasmid maintenance system antidote protein VapI
VASDGEERHDPGEVIRLALEKTGSGTIRELSEKIGVSERAIRRFQNAEKASTYQETLAIFRAAGLLEDETGQQ